MPPINSAPDTQNPTTYIQQAPNNTGPYGLLVTLAGNSDRRDNFFTERDQYGKVMLQHPAVQEAKESLISKLTALCRKPFIQPRDFTERLKYDIGEKGFLGWGLDCVLSVLGVATYGILGKKPAYGVIGSFSTRSKVTVENIDCKQGQAEVSYEIGNTMGTKSGSRFSYYDPKHTFLNDNLFGENTFFSNTKQSWDLSEKINFSLELKE